jgi:hypothetical protein
MLRPENVASVVTFAFFYQDIPALSILVAVTFPLRVLGRDRDEAIRRNTEPITAVGSAVRSLPSGYLDIAPRRFP